MIAAGQTTRSLLVAALLAATCLPARAQLGTASSGENPSTVGATDGRRLGLEQGRVLGRAQALFASFREGFAQGLEESRAEGVLSRLRTQLTQAGRTSGLSEGRAAGREAGIAAAQEGWLRAGRAPDRSAFATPPAPESDLSQSCPPSRPVRLNFGRDLTTEVDPATLEKGGSPFEVDSFDLPYPPLHDLRSRARAAGATAEAVDFWVRDYKFAFQSAWNETFEAQRSGTSVPEREDMKTQGLELGRQEGERRQRCDTGAAFWATGREAGWAEGWRSGFDEAFAETNERHAKRAVVLVQDAKLREASGDGLFEPGEELVLEARLVNAGAMEAKRSAGGWGALRGLESEGHFDGELGPGQSRDVKVDLGVIDPQAPPGTSIVLQVRGLGSDPTTLSERLGRPARIEAAEASLEMRGGRLVGRVLVTVRSTSPASARAELELVGDGESSPIGRLGEGESRQVELWVPAELPASLGEASSGVFVLRTAEGEPWHAGRWSAPFEVADAARLAASEKAPATLSELLLEHLRSEWSDWSAGEDLDELPADLRSYAAAVSELPKKARGRIESSVTEPLLEHLNAKGAPKRLRKAARELLTS